MPTGLRPSHCYARDFESQSRGQGPDRQIPAALARVPTHFRQCRRGGALSFFPPGTVEIWNGGDRQVPPAPGGPGNHLTKSGEPAGSTKESKEALEALEEALKRHCLGHRGHCGSQPLPLWAKIATAQRGPNPGAMPFFLQRPFRGTSGHSKTLVVFGETNFLTSRKRFGRRP